jgi:hypothetical protein
MWGVGNVKREINEYFQALKIGVMSVHQSSDES